MGIEELKAEIERLRAALNKYGQHEYLCDYTAKNGRFSPRLPCTCGWDEVEKTLNEQSAVKEKK